MRSATRCVILPPVPVPYREPLFARLAERDDLAPTVVYLSGRQPAWDQRSEWFPAEHPYEARVLHARQHARAGRTPIQVPRGLGPTLSELDPDCVVSWEFGAATVRAMAWCRRRGRALVIFSEVTAEAEAQLSALQRRMHRLLAPRADGFIAASSRARDRLLSLGVGGKPAEVSLQSADVEPFRAAARARPQDGRPVRVLSVGRLVPAKNPLGLVEAFAAAELDDGEAELELCGTGPLQEEVTEAAARLGVPLRQRGYVEPARLPAVYADADAFALASVYEPFGVAVREAAAAGLPMICTRVAGAAGDVARDGENALLVDPADRGELAAAIRRLVRDPELRARMGEASRRVSDSLSPEAGAEAFTRAVLRASGRG